MRLGRKSYAQQTRTKLLELWRGEEAFGQPLGCVATTFTFDAELFEEQCLARFLSVQGNPNETARAYLIEREEKLSQCFACVLVDQLHIAPDRSLRWNLLPVRLPRGGVQHAKLTMLVWQHCIRVMIGSANLSEPAYRRNQELAAVLDFSAESGLSPDLLHQCVRFLGRVRRFAPGAEREEAGPQAALDEFLSMVRTRADDLPRVTRMEAECALVALVPDAEQKKASVLDALGTLWRDPAPDEAWILSPFFDDGAGAKNAALKLAELLTTRGERKTTFLAPGRRLTDGTVQLDAPIALTESSHRSLTHAFGLVPEEVPVGENRVTRRLHAKALWLQRENRALHMIGSSNFTSAGLGLHPGHNIELNVAYVLNDLDSPLGRLHGESWPAHEELPDTVNPQFLGSAEQSDGEVTDAPLLPGAFGLALYRGDSAGSCLELEILQSAPDQFEVLSRTGGLLLDGRTWRQQGADPIANVPWHELRPPSAVQVRWIDSQGGRCEAYWIVNVFDGSALPPPAELANLTLDELLEVLTSTRPMYETVARILDRRDRRTAAGSAAEIDPHRKVDTSNFLLRRMRRLSHGLEGMRERFEHPVSSLEALRWRLRGPLGALTLAARLADEDPEGAAFMIAEVAVTLRGVAWRPIGSLDSESTAAEVADVLRELQELAEASKPAAALGEYVRATFRELVE